MAKTNVAPELAEANRQGYRKFLVLTIVPFPHELPLEVIS